MKPEGVKKKNSGGMGGNQDCLPKENTPQVVSTVSPLILDDLSSWKISPHADESVIFHLKIRQTFFLLPLFAMHKTFYFGETVLQTSRLPIRSFPWP